MYTPAAPATGNVGFINAPDDSPYTASVGWIRVTIGGIDYFIPAWQ